MGTVSDKLAKKQECERALNKLIELHHGDLNSVIRLIFAMCQSIEHARAGNNKEIED